MKRNFDGCRFKLASVALLVCAVIAAQGAPNLPGNQIDPATGLPIANARNTGWEKEPDKTLAEIAYDNIPIVEVGKDLRDKFGIDVLLPYGAKPPSRDPEWSWENTPIQLRLKNVKASEIFDAMNLVFETAGTPLSWELIMNGHRQTALLRIMPERVPMAPNAIDPSTGLPFQRPPPPPAENSVVFFVGELVGDPKSGGMSLEDLLQTAREVYKAGTGGDPQHIACHAKAQLLIVHARPEEIAFVASTLSAMREKARLDAQRQMAKEHGTEFKPEMRQPKAGSSSGRAGTEAKTNETKAP